ncbi:MAG: hypothetical protein UV74_C0013G0032 [Candidatus Woesebacteria bacterium GW2011_GWB1_43_14]|uniref:Uncharacterized protein n=1 Tax=Candidatus Woesebacteria bacterium GW2011_GWB1_43_14 TaxID=1618578 RepID=A0A0G1DG80_9BACT|nr:MAG: hypothetical protein UV51_C0009G0035 [Candidatus Woesebacteria bacterium GW2011_GWC1_42_9]KKS96910.1 MAG: hypothetical protein UV74_C0013G0032 [Candidatus Woesebacteria bacterium GW2011_GWB1_43_14]
MNFEDWLKEFVETGKVWRNGLVEVSLQFVCFGADFRNLSDEGIASLRKYTNEGKALGVREVWGGKFDAYKAWTKQFIAEYEAEHGIELPALVPSGRKNSGMIQFFGELTAFAAGVMSISEFTLFMEARILNGRLWEEGRKDERVRVNVPTSDKPILLSSFPPSFPLAAWEFTAGGERFSRFYPPAVVIRLAWLPTPFLSRYH